MRYLSVCSGIASDVLAWDPLGWKCAAFSEIDPFCSALLAHHHAAVPNLGDMTRIGDHEALRSPVDVLIGGTPCQSFSVAGLRKGLDDDRGKLALEYCRLAQRLRPRWVVWENVPGVLSKNGGRDFGSILGGLADIGYGFAYRVLDAQYFGLAQRRKRVFVVGHLGDWRPSAAVLFEPESVRRHPQPRRKAQEKVAGPLTARTSASSGLQGEADALVAHTLLGKGSSSHDESMETYVAHSLRGEGFDGSEDGTGRGIPLIANTLVAPKGSRYSLSPEDTYVVEAYGGNRTSGPVDVAAAVTAHGGPHGRLDFESETFIAFDARQSDVLVYGDKAGPVDTGYPPTAIAFSSKDHGQDAAEEIAPTLRAMGSDKSRPSAGGQVAIAMSMRGRGDGVTCELEDGDVSPALRASAGEGGSSKQHVVTTMMVRRLTPRECERLQGFPDDYTLIPYRNKPAKDGPRYKAIGNAIAVPVLRWIGERIMIADKVFGVSKERGS